MIFCDISKWQNVTHVNFVTFLGFGHKVCIFLVFLATRRTEAGAIYCVFVTVTHVDPWLGLHGVHHTIVYSFEGTFLHVSHFSIQ